MPSETMDLQRGSSLCLPSSSFFSEEIRFPERQVGFWKPESLPDFSGTEGTPLMSGKRSISPSMNSWGAVGRNFGVRSDLRVEPMPLFVEGNKVDLNGAHYENSLFSSSLSEVFEKTLRLSSTNVPLGQSVDTLNSNFGEVEPFESLEEIEAQTIGDLLPDDDDLLSGVINDIGFVARLNGGDDMDDIFFTSGGIELEAEDNSTGNRTFDYASGKASVEGLSSQYAGEHPFGEHPSRTLFVRNIHSNVEDAELNALFQQYGDIRTLYTACKHRGFIMVSYYDIRAARNAMKALQNKPLRRRKLDIHYSIPKDNPPEKDINQGTLVVFNLDSSISSDEICQIFGVYGEVKEVRETPHKHHHKFIEFYDVRAAEAALVALNRSDIAGKKIKLELSRPGGARRCSTQQLSPEQELEEYSGCWNGSPPNNSPSGFYGSIPFGTVMSSSGLDHGVVHNVHSAAQAPANPFVETAFRGISPSGSQNLASPIRVASVGNHSNLTGNCELSHSLGQMKFGFQCMPAFHPRSVPDYHNGLTHGISYNSSSARPKVGLGSLSNYPFERNEVAFGVSRNGSCPLHGQQSAWNTSDGYHCHSPSPVTWSNSPAFLNNISSHPPPQIHGAPSHILNAVHHHVGSAPTMNPSFWSSPGSVGSVGMHPHSIFPHSGGNCVDPAQMVINSPQQRCHFHARVPPPFDDRIRSRRNDPNANQADNKKLYELDVSRIIRGEDSRTTLMIKNIPNKYTSKMLLAAIDEQNRGTYDFIYLPIDFKNKCNVGYAFINMINPQHIIPFYQAFNGKKWEKFNSEKVATLAYARIQGKTALVAHFQNSSLMNEDKRCRPILFHSDGPNAGDQEPFPVGINIRSRPCRSRMCGRDETHRESPSTSPNGDEIYNGLDSSLASTNAGEEQMISNHAPRGN